MLVFNLYPVYFAQIGFKEYNVTMGTNLSLAHWVGLSYIKEFLNSPDFSNVMINTIGISFFKLLVGFPIPIIFALLLNEIKQSRFKKFIQTVTYLPHFLSWIIVAGIMLIWLADSGLLTKALYHMHIVDDTSNMLANANYFWAISVISELWKEFGWNSIIYLAAIAGIDMELFEAARIDGAGKFRQIWNITLPSIAPTVVLMLILSISGLFGSNFDQIFVLRNAVNAPASNVIDIYVYQQSFMYNRFDYATAVGLFRSLVSAILLVGANAFARRSTGNSIF
ncbi:MAG: ABC transporter permease subunit [Clostridiales bacterium]|nr:ABC transporter permease subunit [Clostridiales bacterium]